MSWPMLKWVCYGLSYVIDQYFRKDWLHYNLGQQLTSGATFTNMGQLEPQHKVTTFPVKFDMKLLSIPKLQKLLGWSLGLVK